MVKLSKSAFITGKVISAVITRTAHIETMTNGNVKYIARSLTGFRTMSLWGEIETASGTSKVDMFSIPMHVSYLSIEAFAKGSNAPIWTSVSLVAPGSHEAKEAWHKIKGLFPLVPESIDLVLLAEGYPHIEEFDVKAHALLANRARYLRLAKNGYCKAIVKGYSFDDDCFDEVATTK